ncbi:hypothetical protein PCANC_15441 [Puccinia coronata f. sp. avenae]|uniref:Uncharacterized protein n=1 Tax=Puccinia coronata f. sp. avenae TaxID=200324 RepID=A0A2N5UHS2_9BASI|nr:hypothetical protein PCANC_15441 [Puccinia coronata f. sp. avenae]
MSSHMVSQMYCRVGSLKCAQNRPNTHRVTGRKWVDPARLHPDSMGTGAGTVSQVAPLVHFTQSCDQAGTAASLGHALSWEIVPLCTEVQGEITPVDNILAIV